MDEDSTWQAKHNKVQKFQDEETFFLIIDLK